MSKSTKTTTENKPPAWAEPLFKQSADEAKRLYDSGVGGNTYLGPTVANLSDTTMSGVNQLRNAGVNWDTGGTRGVFADIGAASALNPYDNKLSAAADLATNTGTVDTSKILGGTVNTSAITGGGPTSTARLTGGRTNTSGIVGGTTNAAGITGGRTDVSGVKAQNVGTDQYNGATGTANLIGSAGKDLLGGIAGGNTGIRTEADYRSLYSKAGAPSAAETYLADSASGKFLAEGNPYYRERLQSQLDDTAAQVRSSMSGAGRYGSNVSNRVLTEELGKQRVAALENDWNRERALQMEAVGMLDDARARGWADQMSAITGITGVQGQNIQNRLAATGQYLGALNDKTTQLRGIADSKTGVMTGNADRGLEAGIARAGFSQGDMERGLEAGRARADFERSDLQRGLDAEIAKAGYQQGDLNRNLEAVKTRMEYQSRDKDRNLEAATTRAGFQQGDLERNLEAEKARSDYGARDLDRSLQGKTLQGNLLAQAGDLYGRDLDRSVASTNAMRDIDQQNFENRLAGADATLKAGGMLDAQAQKQLADEVAKFYALDNQDWNRLSMLQGAATGAAGDYGVQNQTTRQPMNVGGLLSGIGSLFSGKSDIRAKENIVHVGWMNGLRIFEFSYRGQKARWRGVMAQDLPLHKAEALHLDADGFYSVDYSKLGFPMTRVN